MKTFKWIILSWLAGTTIGLAGDELPFRTDINPALQYFQSFLVAPDFPQPERDYLFTNDWRGQKLPKKFGELIAGYDKQFALVRHAGKSVVRCDWGLDMSPGPATLLPHLARCKAVAQTARLRVRWDLQQGRQPEALEDWLAAFALARNCSGDGTLISVLVQIAMESILCQVVAENFYEFAPETLRQLVAGLDAAPGRGTIATSIPMEKAFFVDWLEARILAWQKQYPGHDDKVMAAFRELVVGLNDSEENQISQTRLWDQVVKASGGTSAGVIKLIQEEGRIYQKLAAIMALPPRECEDKLQPFNAQVRESSNPLLAMTLPAVTKTRTKEISVEIKLALVKAAVQYRLQGESGLKRVLDPWTQSPFVFERFVFEGVDRGFKLQSPYTGRGFPETLIFVETEGPLFHVDGPYIGQAISR
jgi:hypothetical protein